MYIIDDICYAGKPGNEIRVIDVQPLKGRMLLVTFSSGEKKLFDATLLNGSAFIPLDDEIIFSSPSVEHGFVSWADGTIDIAPEFIYDQGIRYTGSDDLLLAG